MTILRQTTPRLPSPPRPRRCLARGHDLACLGNGLFERLRQPGSFNEILRAGGGKRCDRSIARRARSMRASVKVSPTTCSFRPPVQGDTELPNQRSRSRARSSRKRRSRFAAPPSSRSPFGRAAQHRLLLRCSQGASVSSSPEARQVPASRSARATRSRGSMCATRRLAATGARSPRGERQGGRCGLRNATRVRSRARRCALRSAATARRQGQIGTFKRVAVSVPDP